MSFHTAQDTLSSTKDHRIFTRMTSRRGAPTYVISDDGTNFVGAERELRKLVEALDADRITQETSKYRPIHWKITLRVPPILVVCLRH